KQVQGAAEHGHGQPPCRGGRPPANGLSTAAKASLQGGDRLQPGPLQGAIARRGSSSHGAATRGHNRLRLFAVHPHGTAASGCPRRTRKELPLAGAVALAAGVATPWQGDCRWASAAPPPTQGQRRQWRVKERVRASFWKITKIPLRI
ncbi:hypothetical protein BHE74_00033034, partial [Ensete ventricosum]